MGKSIADLFKAETEFYVKASEMYGLMREATKAEFLLNAVKCDIPNVYTYQMATGEKVEQQFVPVLEVQKKVADEENIKKDE